MSIELAVTPIRQTTPMSCWWVCMSMVLGYYGQQYRYPWDFRPEFRRPFARVASPVMPDLLYPDIDTAMEYDASLHHSSELTFLQPYEWYDHGLPRSARAFEALSSITGFRGFDRPAFGRWTANDVETRLRRFGPYIFCGFWNGFPHAILVTGLLRNEGDISVVTIDPNNGFAFSDSLEGFNSKMDERMREFNFNSFNPLYLPQVQAVRAVVVDEPMMPAGTR